MSNGRIITDNLNAEFKKATTTGGRAPSNMHGGGYMLKSAILEKTDLPKNVQKKMAMGGIPMGPGGSMGNIRMGNAQFYHPLFQSLNIMLPRDRRERNEWCRHFYRTEPIIATSLDLHTEFPISDFNHVCYDPAVKKFFDYMAFERLDMINLLLDIGLEYWKVGDVFPFGQLNESDGMWERFVILNPDYIDMKSSILAGEPIIELIPDEQIKAIVAAGPRGEYADIYAQLPDDVVRQVKAGKYIKLDNRLVSHLAHKASQYETWGTPILMRCFKTLIYKDKLRESQISIANRHITPLRIFKVGAPGEPMPSQEDLDGLRDILLQAEDDPNFMLVYHYALQTDYVGSSGKILPLTQEFDFIQKELMNGMGINQAMLNGEGPTYANAQVGFDTLARRYMSYRLRLESWIRHKVYKPIAEIQGFYRPVNGEISTAYLSEKEQRRLANKKDMQLVIPDIAWQHQDLTSNQAVLNFIQQLQAKGLVSMTTILPMLNLDPETEKKNLESEKGTVFDPNAPKVNPNVLDQTGGGGGAPGGPAPKPAPGAPAAGGPPRPGTPPAPGGKPGTPTPSPGGKPSPNSFGFPGPGGQTPNTKAPSPNATPPSSPSGGGGAPTPSPSGGGSASQTANTNDKLVREANLTDFLAPNGNAKKSSTSPRSLTRVRRRSQENQQKEDNLI